MSRTRHASLLIVTVCEIVVLSGQGCPGPPSGPAEGDSAFNNTTDPTNGGATYLGSAACRACHSEVGALHSLHGHAHMLNSILGQPPTYPAQATRANVPNPPMGYTWDDISYVIGGYLRKAHFLDRGGFIIVGDNTSPLTQWNLSFPANGTNPGFAAYEPATTASSQPYDYSCFVCHVTGPQPQDPNSPRFQENRPGFLGTWQEAGVQCEACHGPGSNHPPNTSARTMYVNSSAAWCGRCHSRSFDAEPTVIQAQGGFISGYQQYTELLSSGGHAGLDCTMCHDPHAGPNYDRTNAIRNECTACHPDENMALHEGIIFVQGNYVEPVTCVSCHMPFATRSATSAIMGQSAGRVGDVRTHVFRINTRPADYTAMFAADRESVARDAAGRAEVTLDFVCLRCHNTTGATPFRLTLASAGQIAPGVHGIRQGANAARR